MATWRVNNSTALGGEVCAQWTTGHAYSLGARVVCRFAYATTSARAYVYECTTAGTSHGSTEPTWPSSGTVADNDIVWTCRNPNDGTWDNASCYVYYVVNHAAVASGDSIYIHYQHNENVTYTLASFVVNGSTDFNNPLRYYSVDKTDDSIHSGAIVRFSRNGYHLYFSGCIYSYGVSFQSNSAIRLYSESSAIILEGDGSTTLLLWGTDTARTFDFGSSSPIKNSLTILNGNVDIQTAGSCFSPGGGNLVWKKGSIIAASGVTKLIDGNCHARTCMFEDIDFSEIGNGATATSLVDVSDTVATCNMKFVRCKLPTDAGFTMTVGSWTHSNGRVLFHHCSSDNKAYDFYEQDFCGTVSDETTIVLPEGASDGTTSISLKMESNANALDRILGLESPSINAWTNSTTEKTFSIEVVHDSATALQNDEIWMELHYPVNNTDGLGGYASSRCGPLVAAADITDSTEPWTTTGLTNPNTRKLSVTVTPGKKGPVMARVYLAKASTTVYVDPFITES